MEFIYAAWPALVCFFIMLTASILTFFYARRYGADPVTLVMAFVRSLPHHWRMLRDPVYRRKFRCVERFGKQILDLVTAISARNMLNRVSDTELGEACKVPPENIALARQRLERAMADEFDRSKRAAAEYLAGLSDEDIAIVAADLSDEWYQGLVGPPPIDAWLRKERELASKSPVMVASFLSRAPKIKDSARGG